MERLKGMVALVAGALRCHLPHPLRLLHRLHRQRPLLLPRPSLLYLPLLQKK